MKKRIIVFMGFICAALLGGCGKSEQGGRITFTDALGAEVSMDQPGRTAVLSGSLARAWQLAGGELAAVTEDYAREEGAVLSEDMVNLGLLKNPGVEALLAADIDFAVLTANIPGHVKLRDTLEAAGIVTAYFQVESFEEYAEMMRIFTDITGEEALYQENVAAVRELIDTQIARADGSSPKVLLLRAYSTGVKAKGSDSMTGRMLQELGAVNIADSEDSLLKDISMEAIVEQDPDFIFVTTMGDSQEKALKMVEEMLASSPVWEDLEAVKHNRYYVLPKALFHNKPNQRWGESYQILADILYGGQ